MKCYYWNYKDRLFTHFTNKELCIGCNGGYGIYLDENLNKGSTQSTNTFGNPPLLENDNFICKDVELWSFHW